MIVSDQQGLGFKEIFSQSWRLYLFCLPKVFLLSLSGAILVCVPHIILAMIYHDVIFHSQLDIWLVLLYTGVPNFIISLLILLSLYHGIRQLDEGKPHALSEDLMHGLRSLPHGVIAMLAYLLIISFGLMLFIVPGVFICIALFFFFTLIALENKNIITSFKESYNLVVPNWEHCFYVLVIPFFVLVSVTFSLHNFTNGIITHTHANGIVTDFISSTLAIIFGVLFSPWYICVAYTLYKDLLFRARCKLNSK